MKKVIIWLLCISNVVLAGNNLSEIRREKKVIEVKSLQELPDSVQALIQESKEPLEVEKKHKKDKKAIIFTALRLVLTVVVIVLLVVLILVLI